MASGPILITIWSLLAKFCVLLLHPQGFVLFLFCFCFVFVLFLFCISSFFISHFPTLQKQQQNRKILMMSPTKISLKLSESPSSTLTQVSLFHSFFFVHKKKQTKNIGPFLIPFFFSSPSPFSLPQESSKASAKTEQANYFSPTHNT